MPSTLFPRYVNVRSNTMVEVLNEGSGTLRIVTVTDDGYGRRRNAPANSFHKHYLGDDGKPHTTGYVPVNTLPGTHPCAIKTEVDRMELLERLDGYSNDELAALILEQQKILADAKAVIEKAKAVTRSRRKEAGLEIHGDVAVVYSTNDRFDPDLAVRNLEPADLHRISVMKPDATLARTVFKGEPKKLAACIKKGNLKVEVRQATADDYLKALEERRKPVDDEDFDLESVNS